MTYLAVVIAAVIGAPIGLLVRKTSENRSDAILTGVMAAAVVAVVAARLYVTQVLCPPGAGCA